MTGSEVSILTDDQLNNAVAAIDRLLDKGELSELEEQYLDDLSMLVEAYESDANPIPRSCGHRCPTAYHGRRMGACVMHPSLTLNARMSF